MVRIFCNSLNFNIYCGPGGTYGNVTIYTILRIILLITT